MTTCSTPYRRGFISFWRCKSKVSWLLDRANGTLGALLGGVGVNLGSRGDLSKLGEP